MILPPKLKAGDEVRIIAPSCSLTSMQWFTDTLFDRAKCFFTDRGMRVSEGASIREVNAFGSTTIEHRLADLSDAFRDPYVQALFCIRGGWNCNQLLDAIDYELIQRNPKILCGFSDITALSNAIYAKTGVVTYSGPNFNQFAYGSAIDYTYRHVEAALMQEGPIELRPSDTWIDTPFEDGKPWLTEKNDGWQVLQAGEAEGTSIGGNLCTLSLLQGTEFMPTPEKSILFIEDDHETHPRTFDRDLTSLSQQPWFQGVQGILIGRCQQKAVNTEFGPVTRDILSQIVANNPRLRGLPIIANIDFGHTHPIITFPIGGTVKMKAANEMRIEITVH